jgi:osmotically-inducible protein OsmY
MVTSKLLGKALIGIGLVISLSACAAMNNAMMAQKKVDDAAVTAKVKEALAKDPTLKKYTIDVRTISGEVVM